MTLPVLLALVLAALNGAAALVGSFLYLRSAEGRHFWPLLRTAQGAAVAYAAYVAVVVGLGHHPRETLFYLYALLPVAVGFIAEQFRIAAAQLVLAKRGLADAQAVGRLPRDEQYRIVVAILRRELGVMTVAAWVVLFLALRAAQTAHGL